MNKVKKKKKRLKKDVEYKIVKCKLKSILKNSYWLDDIKKTDANIKI